MEPTAQAFFKPISRRVLRVSCDICISYFLVLKYHVVPYVSHIDTASHIRCKSFVLNSDLAETMPSYMYLKNTVSYLELCCSFQKQRG